MSILVYKGVITNNLTKVIFSALSIAFLIIGLSILLSLMTRCEFIINNITDTR